MLSKQLTVTNGCNLELVHAQAQAAQHVYIFHKKYMLIEKQK